MKMMLFIACLALFLGNFVFAENSSDSVSQQVTNRTIIASELEVALYDLHYSEEDALCKQLLHQLNQSLQSSQLINYADVAEFLNWQVLVSNSNKMMSKSSPDYAWLSIVKADLNNDGNVEILVKKAGYKPLRYNTIYAFSEDPSQITSGFLGFNSSYQQFSDLFRKFLEAEKKSGNAVLYQLAFHKSFPLKKSPDYDSHLLGLRFNAIAADFNLYFHQGREYLAVDPLHYEPTSKDELRSIPWYVLFELKKDNSLNEFCIYKRQE